MPGVVNVNKVGTQNKMWKAIGLEKLTARFSAITLHSTTRPRLFGSLLLRPPKIPCHLATMKGGHARSDGVFFLQNNKTFHKGSSIIVNIIKSVYRVLIFVTPPSLPKEYFENVDF